MDASETLTEAQRARVRARLGPVVRAVAQDERSRARNRELALERLAAFLLEMARRSGVEDTLELAMPRHDIADYRGLTLETVSRMFAELKEAGVIKLASARRVELLDLAELEARAA